MKRAIKYELNAIVTTLIVVGILVFVMLIAYKHPKSYDLTKNRKHTLSEQTTKLLKSLTTPVKAIGFFNKGDEEKAKDLLQQYRYGSSKFSYEFVDPNKNPLLAKKYDITLAGVIVLESGDKREKVRTVDEESLTNSLLKVTRSGKKAVYFLTGHNELSLDDSRDEGLSILKESLEKEVYEAKPLSFVSDKKVPDDAKILVIAGPRKALYKEELDLIKAFVDKGGKVFWLLGGEFPEATGEWLKQYGIKVDKGIVIDQVSRYFGGDVVIPAIMQYGSHAITEGFRLVCFFPFTRSLEIEKKLPAGVTVAELAFSSPKSWNETGLKEAEATSDKIRFDPKTERQGPLCVAAAVTSKTAGAPPPPPPSPGASPAPKEEKKEGRMVVFGSAEIADNAFVTQSGNRDLLMNAMGWLAEEESLISIRPKDESGQPLSLTPKDISFIRFFTVLFFPLLFIFIGIWVRIRRG
ncbi:MAG: GldG family protein [Candidatus Eremiobacteraeota bacterium]|nr:GldG family protein [Candidatus Eremiobacteraeota bacterium]